MKAVLAAAGRSGTVRVVYQPRSGDLVEHWENFAWLCLKRENMVIVCDEVDSICSAGSAKNADSAYWKKSKRPPALDQIVQFGRHSRVAFVGVSRAPQDVWRRLRGQALEMLVFQMDDDLEMDALRSRLGSNTDRLPTLQRFEYLDWFDGGEVSVCGGRE